MGDQLCARLYKTVGLSNGSEISILNDYLGMRNQSSTSKLNGCLAFHNSNSNELTQNFISLDETLHSSRTSSFLWTNRGRKSQGLPTNQIIVIIVNIKPNCWNIVAIWKLFHKLSFSRFSPQWLFLVSKLEEMSQRPEIWLQRWNDHTNWEDPDKSYYYLEGVEKFGEGKEFKQQYIENGFGGSDSFADVAKICHWNINFDICFFVRKFWRFLRKAFKVNEDIRTYW